MNAVVDAGTLLSLLVDAASPCEGPVEVRKGGCLFGAMLNVRGVFSLDTGGPGILTLSWLSPTDRCAEDDGLSLLAC